MHRLIADEWSLSLVVDSLLAYGRSPTSNSQLQYLDYANWQRTFVNNRIASASQEDTFDWLPYWKTKFSVAPPVLQLPIDRPRSPTPDWICHRKRCELDLELSTAVTQLALDFSTRVDGLSFSQEEVDKRLSTLILVAYALLLHRFTGEEDVVIAIQLPGRPRREAINLLGPLANTLYLRTNVHRHLTLRELYTNVEAELNNILSRQEMPGEVLFDTVFPEEQKQALVSQVCFKMQGPRGQQTFHPLESSVVPSPYDLTLSVAGAKGMHHHRTICLLTAGDPSW